MIYQVWMRIERFGKGASHGGFIVAADEDQSLVKAQELLQRNLPYSGPATLYSVLPVTEERVVELLNNSGDSS